MHIPTSISNLLLALALAFSGWDCGFVFAGDEFEQEPILYSNSPSDDPVAQLQRKLQTGEVRLSRDPKHGHLPSLLRALDISPESQVLVFSKTSLQIHRISPSNPRAIYFNDSVYVGYVPGSDTLEISANAPQLGAVFYTLDSDRDEPNLNQNIDTSERMEDLAGLAKFVAREPRLVRDRGQCLACHASSRTEGVPGHLMRSIYPDRSGRARSGSTSYTVDDRTPFERRWGGWYVTGTHGSMRHMGNLFAVDAHDAQSIDMELGANMKQLPARVRSDRYLTPHSDIVALMVLEHQTRIHNLITRANFETRQAMYLDDVMNRALGRPKDHRSESTARRIAAVGDALMVAMLMIDEYPLANAVQGTSEFATRFSNQGPTTCDGKSLRQLDLNQRLFRYPLSFLIYTPEFRQLPHPVLEHVQGVLRGVLSEAPLSSPYDRLKLEDRKNLSQIVRETMPELLY